MLAVLYLELFVAPKNIRMPMGARIFVAFVLYRNPGLLFTFSIFCLVHVTFSLITVSLKNNSKDFKGIMLDIHSIRSWFLFENIAIWCSSDSFWLLRPHLSNFSTSFTTVNVLLLFRIWFTFTVGIWNFFGFGVTFIPPQTIFNVELKFNIVVT